MNRKKLFTAILALVLIVALLPVNGRVAFADSGDVLTREDVISKVSAVEKYLKDAGNHTISDVMGKSFSDSVAGLEFDDANAPSYVFFLDVAVGVFEWTVTFDGKGLTSVSFQDIDGLQTWNLSHIHDWAYSADGATLTAECKEDKDCDLPDRKVSVTLIADKANYSGSPISKSDIFGSMDFSAFNDVTGNSLSVDSIVLYASTDEERGNPLSEILASGQFVAELTLGGATAACDVLVTEMTYTLTIPAMVNADKEGWNALGDGITIRNLQNPVDPMDGLKVSADSENGWKLVKDTSQNVRYGLRASELSDSDVTEFRFAKGDIVGETGKTIACGVFINVEDYENAPAGEYTDTITWTVSAYREN